MLKDSIWFACHELPRMVYWVKFRFFTRDTAHYFDYPEYLIIDYYYKNSTLLDTVYLDSIAHLGSTVKLSRVSNRGNYVNSIFWNNEIIESTEMKLKYMTIAIDNGLFGAE